MWISLSKTFMESKSSKREHQPILNSVRQRQVFCSAQMLPREAWTSLKLTGLFSMTLLMILKITFIELVVQPEELMARAVLCSFYWSMNLGSSAT
jgi:hypothetical protein